tara:strand:+ start:1033 stop:1602 length:570 start_codon:yes stop_codon:yes gene_type:complete
MNNKIYILIVLLIISFKSFSQITEPCIIYLKSGEVITDMRGTFTKKHFKYYKKVGNRFNKIKLELIDSVDIIEKSGYTRKMRFLPVKDEKKMYALEQILTGNLELYRQTFYNGSVSDYDYFIRRKGDDKLTSIGHQPTFGDKKKKEILYPFLEKCPELIKRIENDEFHIIRDLSLIIGTYNLTCGLKSD